MLSTQSEHKRLLEIYFIGSAPGQIMKYQVANGC